MSSYPHSLDTPLRLLTELEKAAIPIGPNSHPKQRPAYAKDCASGGNGGTGGDAKALGFTSTAGNGGAGGPGGAVTVSTSGTISTITGAFFTSIPISTRLGSFKPRQERRHWRLSGFSGGGGGGGGNVEGRSVRPGAGERPWRSSCQTCPSAGGEIRPLLRVPSELSA